MLSRVKTALRITTAAYNTEIEQLIKAARLDLGIAGVEIPCVPDELVERAIITYCRLHFGDLADGQYDRLKASYDEQKAQLSMATGYTKWGVSP